MGNQIGRHFNVFIAIDSLPIFSTLSFFEKQLVAAKAQIVEYEKGHSIYKEGAAPDYFYCMISGRVEIFQSTGPARSHVNKTIEHIRRGEFTGSISALTGKPHSVGARALNDSTLVRISASDFNYLLKKIPALSFYLSRALSRRLSKVPKSEVFKSVIIAVFGIGTRNESSMYASALSAGLGLESAKKVALVRSSAVSSKKEAARFLGSLIEKHHYVVIDTVGQNEIVRNEILKQSDMCHFVSASDARALKRTASLRRYAVSTTGRHAVKDIAVVIIQDRMYDRTSYEKKCELIGHSRFVALSMEKTQFKNTIHHVAREVSGSLTGLALGSGAAMGLAHVGVLKVLEHENIRIDHLAGTSMGALIGALWVTGIPARDIEKIASKFKSAMSVFLLLDPTLPIRGLIKGNTVRKFLRLHLGDKTFYDTKIPLKIIACDIKRRREVVLESGSLVDAVMASIAIPGVFEPVLVDRTIQLVDGGIVNPLPVGTLTKAGLRRIIAVNTLPSPDNIVRMERKKLSIYDVIVNSFQAMEYSIAAHTSRHADVYLHPIPEFADWYEFHKAPLFIKEGVQHTRRALPLIKELVKKA
ncbi:MAG: patatin-like phospholipase family protein [Candidatus Omnitrophota bacterium]